MFMKRSNKHFTKRNPLPAALQRELEQSPADPRLGHESVIMTEVVPPGADPLHPEGYTRCIHGIRPVYRTGDLGDGGKRPGIVARLLARFRRGQRY
jgi:hypothetical protein